MSAEFYGVEDAEGDPVKVKRWGVEKLFTLTTYDLVQLRERMLAAVKIARHDEPLLRKALLYFDHALLVFGEASNMPFKSPHEAFYRGLAFLQLYKGLSLVIGEPGTDRDYQSRFRKLGLPHDFLSTRVKPLYDVRNDEDVAHYSREFPDSDAFVARFQQAVAVFRDTLVAYARSLDSKSA
jgi:hypothetical protein